MGVTTERGLPLEWGGPEDKNVQWKAPASTIVDPDGRFYFASAGKMVVIQAGPELEILAESDLGDPSLATAAVSGGRIFLKGTRFLYAIGNKWASNLEQGLIT
jgi:hypothetical protein